MIGAAVLDDINGQRDPRRGGGNRGWRRVQPRPGAEAVPGGIGLPGAGPGAEAARQAPDRLWIRRGIAAHGSLPCPSTREDLVDAQPLAVTAFTDAHREAAEPQHSVGPIKGGGEIGHEGSWNLGVRGFRPMPPRFLGPSL